MLGWPFPRLLILLQSYSFAGPQRLQKSSGGSRRIVFKVTFPQNMQKVITGELAGDSLYKPGSFPNEQTGLLHLRMTRCVRLNDDVKVQKFAPSSPLGLIPRPASRLRLTSRSHWTGSSGPLESTDRSSLRCQYFTHEPIVSDPSP